MPKKKRDSFVFYRSFYEAAQSLPNEQKGEFLGMICGYALNGKLIDSDDGIVNGLMSLVKPQLDANYKKYLNGCKGGSPKGICNNPKGRNGKRE